MISIVADILHTVFDRVIVAGGDEVRLDELGLTCCADPVPDKGALGGIYNGLINTDADSIFFCGCDMPLLKPAVIRRIIDNMADEDVLMAMVNNIRQPLHAVYKRKILPAVEELIAQENKYLPDLFQDAVVRHLAEAAMADIPDYRLSFVSLDSPSAVSQYKPHLDKL